MTEEVKKKRGRPKGSGKTSKPKKTPYKKLVDYTLDEMAKELPELEERLNKHTAFYTKNPDMGIGWQIVIENLTNNIRFMKERLGQK